MILAGKITKVLAIIAGIVAAGIIILLAYA